MEALNLAKPSDSIGSACSRAGMPAKVKTALPLAALAPELPLRLVTMATAAVTMRFEAGLCVGTPHAQHPDDGDDQVVRRGRGSDDSIRP